MVKHNLEGIPFVELLQKNKCGGSYSCVCVCAKVLKKARVEKKKKELKKKSMKKSFKVLFVKEMVQNIEFGPKCCMNLPFICKS